MEHPAFAEAGGQQGLEIWTIDKFEPVAIPSTDYGKFYNGDAYIVLKTTGDDVLTYDVHFWLGKESTQDKQGAAAILTVVLDDQLGGRAVHSREVQKHESGEFLSYFKPAVRYLEGGLESGFNQVTTNAGAEKRLLKLTGSDNLRISEVPAEIGSLTKSNCFILEVEHDIFVLISAEAKATQRRKIISIATKLRDDEHNGRATIEIIDEFSCDEDVAAFFEALGSGSQDEIADDSGEDEQTYTRDGTSVLLYKVGGSAEDLELSAVSKPYKQAKLTSDGMFIVDTPNEGIYIWIGSEVDPELKKAYNSFGQSYLTLKGYPTWVHVSKVSQGSENCSFIQNFTTWDTAPAGVVATRFFMSAADEGYHSSDAAESTSTAKKIAKTGAARGFMPDDGSGNFVVYRVSGGEATEVYTSESDFEVSGGVRLGAFFQDDAYIVKYSYSDADGNDAFILYYWIGSGADKEDKRSAAAIAGDMSDELEGESTIVKVPQGKETKHFLKLFKGNLLVLMGGLSTEYKGANTKGSFDEDGVRLFKVRGTQVGDDMRATQVPENADSLEDDGVFVLDTPSIVYVWKGKDSTSEEADAAVDFVQNISKTEREVVTVEQGEESDEFWDALGGASEAGDERSGWKSELSRRVNTKAALYDACVNLKGVVKFEKVPKFSQEDLSQDGVYILDTGEELYLWLGASLPERVKSAKSAIIEEYLKNDGLERADSAVVVTVKQGKEPALFKRIFPAWDADLFSNQKSYADIKAETKASNTK